MISVRGLRKHYKVHKRPPGLKAAFRSLFHRNYTTVKAVDGISFEIRPGERVGFLGPNGAGKTTTLKVLSGLLHPTEGEVTVDGHVPRQREAAFLKKIMLVMGQKQQLLWDLPPAETFELNRAIYDVPRAQFKQTLDELIALLELGELIQQADPPALAGRADEVRAGRGAHPPAQGALPRRADHRPRRVDAGDDARLHQGVQRAARRHDHPHQPLHGRRRGAVPARHRHRQGAAVLRRQAWTRWCSGCGRRSAWCSAWSSPWRPRAWQALGRVVSHEPRHGGAPGASGGGERHGQPRAGHPAGHGPDGRERAARGGDERAVRREQGPPGRRGRGGRR